jgi:hypothetical protein
LAFQENTEKSKSIGKADQVAGRADISNLERKKKGRMNARLARRRYHHRHILVRMPVLGLVSSFPRQHR